MKHCVTGSRDGYRDFVREAGALSDRFEVERAGLERNPSEMLAGTGRLSTEADNGSGNPERGGRGLKDSAH